MTTKRTTCAGCHHPPKTPAPWCSNCERRLPEHLRTDVVERTQDLADAHREGTAWLQAHPRLSDRELDVLRLVAEGLKDAQIGDRLGISVNTVRDSIKRVTRRLGCTGRTHLIAVACRKGYLAPERV